MNQELREDHITKKTVVYRISRMDAVTVMRDLEYRTVEGGALTMDVYYPPEARSGDRRPAVVSVAGYPDPGMQRMFGCKFKDWGSSTSWARLIAASGLVAVNYSNREPVNDVQALVEHLRENAPSLGIDRERIALLASSGHGPLALSVLMDDRADPALRCAVLLCPFTMDVDGFTALAEAAKTFRFVNPTSGRSVSDLPRATPLFVVRAGQDQMPGLNETLDRFVAKAMAGNLPVTLIHHADAPHAFDLVHDSEVSREIVREALAFMSFHLRA